MPRIRCRFYLWRMFTSTKELLFYPMAVLPRRPRLNWHSSALSNFDNGFFLLGKGQGLGGAEQTTYYLLSITCRHVPDNTSIGKLISAFTTGRSIYCWGAHGWRTRVWCDGTCTWSLVQKQMYNGYCTPRIRSTITSLLLQFYLHKYFKKPGRHSMCIASHIIASNQPATGQHETRELPRI